MFTNDCKIEPRPTGQLSDKSGSDVLHAVLMGLLNTFSYPAAVFDPNYRLMTCNKQFSLLLNVDQNEPEKAASAHFLKDLVAGSQHWPRNGSLFELKIDTTQGNMPFLASLSQFNLSTCGPLGTILSLSPMFDSCMDSDALCLNANPMSLASTLQKVREYAKQAEAANKAKSEFLTNMSHEIRTPLNGVLGTINLLLGTDLTDQQRRYAETSKNSGESLMGLLNDILDFSKIESGHMAFEDISFSLSDVLEDVAEIISHRLTKKHLQLLYYLEPGCPEMVRGDIGRVRQILVNLAGNAVKFTSEGSIIIKIGLKATEHCNHTLYFQVKDTGIGIPQNKINRLFTPFTQVDASTTRKFGGTGLGLSICKRLVSLMGGEIGVESQEGHGSTFWFTLKLGKVEESNLQAARLEGRILLVGPEHALAMPTLALKGLGLTVESVSDSDKVAHILNDCDGFRAIVIDYDMGMESLMEIAEYSKKKSLDCRLLLLLPVYEISDEIEHLKKAGYNYVLTKPIKRSELIKALDDKSAHLQSTRSVDLTEESREEASKYRLLLVEDNQVNQMVALGFLKKMGYSVDVVANGQEAVTALSHIHYDLVLMDCQMPVMDGYEATALIRCGESPAMDMSVPIVAMTANAMAGDKEKCLNVGMNDYISKPIIPSQLQQVLKKWLGRKKEEPTPAPKKTKLKPAWERFAKTRRPA